jgi:glucosamine--fructose-6-phosphate aminotransferase (isomerizing)
MATLLEQEIQSQPDVIARLLDQECDHIARIAAALPAFDYVMIAARGSSDHAALFAKYVWAALAGIPVALAAPSLYTLYDAPPRMKGALVIGISQSGQSPDIRAVLAEGKRQGCPTLAITNDGASPLAQEADYIVELHAGPEQSVAATKTYTAQLAVIAAFAACWSHSAQRQAELRAIPAALVSTLTAPTPFAVIADRFRQITDCVVVGRGYNIATSFELALKLKELTYALANPYSSADFRHGPIATVTQGSPAVLIAPSGKTLPDLLDLAGSLRERGADLVIIADDHALLDLATAALPLPAQVPEWLSPLTTIIPGQQLALHLALAKDQDPDKPRGLRKVTKTL